MKSSMTRVNFNIGDDDWLQEHGGGFNSDNGQWEWGKMEQT